MQTFEYEDIPSQYPTVSMLDMKYIHKYMSRQKYEVVKFICTVHTKCQSAVSLTCMRSTTMPGVNMFTCLVPILKQFWLSCM